MLLLNRVAESRARKFLPGGKRIPDAASLAERAAQCADRFALQPDVAEFVGNLLLQQSDLLCSSLDLLRMPGPSTWIEWTVGERQDAPSFRIGLLVETEESGRAGDITVTLENERGEAEVSPASFRFDLDAAGRGASGLREFAMDHDGLPLAPLFECMQGVIDPAWSQYWLSTGSGRMLAAEKRKLARSLWMAPAMLFAFCLVLTANAQMERREVEYDRLNRKRTRHGKPRLLSHTELHLKLFAHSASHGDVVVGESGRSVRLHHVRGHFVRRGNAIFWRKAHLRGDNDLAAATYRTKRVSLA